MDALISQRITAALVPETLELSVLDAASHKYHVRVVSQAFDGKGLLQRHKLVNACVKEELLDGRIHALTIDAVAPSEVKK